MNCEKCGIKIMSSIAKQQEGDENLCRECYTSKRVSENDERMTK